MTNIQILNIVVKNSSRRNRNNTFSLKKLRSPETIWTAKLKNIKSQRIQKENKTATGKTNNHCGQNQQLKWLKGGC
jgi:hypothetical protein